MFYVWVAWANTISARPESPQIAIVVWVHATIAVLLIGTALFMRVYPLVCAVLTLVLLGFWSLASISVLPINTGYPPVLFLALWALYCVSRSEQISQWLIVTLAVVAGIGSVFSPIMWRLSNTGGLEYRTGDEMLSWLGLHWVTIISLVLFAWRRKSLEISRRESIMRSREREHLRIASEIHDVLAHSLTLIRMQAAAGLYNPDSAKSNLETIHKVSGDGIAEVRMIVNALRSGNIEVPETMHLLDVVDRFLSAGLRIEADIDASTQQYSPIVQLALHRILTETLTNVLKHQGVDTHVTLSVRDVEEHIEVRVCSRTPAKITQRFPSSGGFGLEGIKERCVALGGEFEFHFEQNTANTFAWLPKDPQ
ncbi:sensory histidine kinase UhpB [Corynebacterium freiburgense]|nr:sensory histidine kinase UhpB [Corynebacterium freiburgense]